jgi:hypothetical protein
MPACRLHDVIRFAEIMIQARAGGLARRVSVHLAVGATVHLQSQGRAFGPGF